MKIFRLTLLVSIISFTSSAFADPHFDVIKSILGKINTLAADFSQVVIDEVGNVVQDQKGFLQIKKPNKFTWHVKSPSSILVVSDGRKMWQYDEELEQVSVNWIKDDIHRSPLSILSGNTKQLEKIYNIKKIGTKNYKLTPKIESNFEWLTIDFDSVNRIREVVVLDKLGQKTSLRLRNVRKNLSLSDGLFIFKAPPDIDVIE